MDTTKFIVSSRDSALLYGDYSTYQNQLGKKLLNCRKKLSIATRNRGKYQKKDEVTAEQIAENHEYVNLLLLTSERAWAHAMSMKTAHSTDSSGITGHNRKHIISRMDKAARTAESLAELLAQPDSGVSDTDRLEATAYAALIRGGALFEKQAWEPCVRSYSLARVIYSAMASTATKGDIFKDLLTETIDPSIRYAAYQLKTPRTVPVPVIARKAFPGSDDAFVVKQVNAMDAGVLKQGDAESKKESAGGAETGPKTLTWRSREVKIEDAAISLAWGRLQQAKSRLSEKSSTLAEAEPKDAATAYEEILAAAQDAVDATKEAIDELRGEGVSQSDPRMQSLQITRTAVNYELISWRIGRNRVVTGDRDGAVDDYMALSQRKSKKEPTPAQKRRLEAPSRKIAKLKELTALYDGILQSVESAKELPGVAANEALSTKLQGTTQYFMALKSLSIARSHDVADNPVNALALIKLAHSQAESAISNLSQDAEQPSTDGPRNINVASANAEYLQSFLGGELQRHRAIVHISNLQKDAETAAEQDVQSVPLIERLHEYPVGGVDLNKIVDIPPKMAPVPVKPIFLDIAWNYIDYPGTGAAAAKEKVGQDPGKKAPTSAAATEKQEQPAQKKGWFGFGR